MARRLSAFLDRRPRFRLGFLLAAPLFWLGLVYIAALAALLVTAFWTVDTFTGEVQHRVDPGQHHHGADRCAVPDGDAAHGRRSRSLVTIVDILIALPIAFFMAKVASPRLARILVIAVLMPLWASYLVKAYAWRSVLAEGGLVDWARRRSAAQAPATGCRPSS